MLAAFTGWGIAAARATGIVPGKCGWAASAAWGMAVVIALGGVLALVGQANRPVLILIAVVGCGFTAAWFRPRAWKWGAVTIFAVTLLLWYIPSVASSDFEPYDDYLAYIPFAKRLLETGTLIEPSSFRRLTTYGGQSLAGALTIAFGSARNLNLLDSGIATVILGGLVYGMFRRTGAALAVLLVPIARHNTMSQTTGIVMWLGLFLAARERSAVLTGLLLAALCSLRSNYIPAAVIVAVWLVITDWRHWWRAGAAACAALLPWALLLHRSSGTVMYPLFHGFVREGYSYAAGAGWPELAQASGRLFSDPNIWFLMVGQVFCLANPFVAASFATMFLVPLYLPFSDPAAVYRYVQPLALGSVVIAATVLVKRKRLAFILGGVLLPFLAIYGVITVRERMNAIASINPAPLFPKDAADRYRTLQAAVPRGEAIYAILPLPPLLDYHANRIYNADLIGCASPPPGMPFFRGPVELKRYLLSLGIHYIAFNDFDHPAIETGYWRWWWRNRAASRNPVLGPMVPYTLDLMDNVDKFAATEEVRLRVGDLTLLRLRPL